MNTQLTTKPDHVLQALLNDVIPTGSGRSWNLGKGTFFVAPDDERKANGSLTGVIKHIHDEQIDIVGRFTITADGRIEHFPEVSDKAKYFAETIGKARFDNGVDLED